MMQLFQYLDPSSERKLVARVKKMSGTDVLLGDERLQHPTQNEGDRAGFDRHPLSIEHLASHVRENDWDEPMLLKAWDNGQASELKASHCLNLLRDSMGPLLRSSTTGSIGSFDTSVLDVLEAMAESE